MKSLFKPIPRRSFVRNLTKLRSWQIVPTLHRGSQNNFQSNINRTYSSVSQQSEPLQQTSKTIKTCIGTDRNASLRGKHRNDLSLVFQKNATIAGFVFFFKFKTNNDKNKKVM